MAIGSNYFSHDYGARNDRKMVRLRMKYQMKGVGIFWSLLEMIYEEGGMLLLSDIDIISNELKEKSAIIEDVINGFDLFENDGKCFWSISAKRRIDKRFEKTKKAQESAEKRWEKSERNANAMRTHSDSNAIKESKEKKSKVKEIQNTLPIGSCDSAESRNPSEPDLKTEYGELQKTFADKDLQKIGLELKTFIEVHKPNFAEPYVDAWNLFAQKRNLSVVESITDYRRNKIRIRSREPGFKFFDILMAAGKNKFYMGEDGKWKLDFNHIIESENNYTKILERK